jgi:RNA polymerase sigma-70 factor (ECF subfamily)
MNNIKHIVEGCIKHNPACQTALFNMFYPQMLNLSFNYMKDKHQAKDIVQLSFIKVFKQIHNYSLDNSLEGWIRRIVINTALDELRNIKRKSISTDIDVSTLTIRDKKYSEDNLNIILRTIDELPPKYKMAFKLNVIEEYPHKKVAQIMGINEGTSKSNVFKAKAKLRNLLKNKLIEEDFI